MLKVVVQKGECIYIVLWTLVDKPLISTSVIHETKPQLNFLSKLLNAKHTQTPRVMTTDKHSSYGATINDLKKNEKSPLQKRTLNRTFRIKGVLKCLYLKQLKPELIYII